MLKSLYNALAPVTAAALIAIASPALALSAAEEAAFEAEIGEAKSKMMAHSATALKHARKASTLALGESVKAKKARLTAQWLEAEALLRLNRSGDAIAIIDKAIAEAETAFSGSKLHADLLRSQGSLNARGGAFSVALPSFLKAQELYADLGEARSQAIVLLNIGSLYSGAREFEQSIAYFRKGRDAFPKDPGLALSAHNNIGNALKGLGRYQEAETAFSKALEFAKQKSSPMLEARILTNIASTQVMGGDAVKAETTATTAMEIAQEHAPTWARFIDGVLAQIELSKGNLAKAETHLERAFDGEDLAKTAAHFREFHETAAECFSRSGNEQQAAAHRAALDRLNRQVAKLSQ